MVDGSMQAMVLEAPETDLKVEEIPVSEPKARKVLLKVTACGVCHTDLHVTKDETPSRRRLYRATRSRDGP